MEISVVIISMRLPPGMLKFGRTGLKVSRLCLGTMNFGDVTDEKTSARILDEALEAGINFIDTADVYGTEQSPDIQQGSGLSEEI